MIWRYLIVAGLGMGGLAAFVIAYRLHTRTFGRYMIWWYWIVTGLGVGALAAYLIAYRLHTGS